MKIKDILSANKSVDIKIPEFLDGETLKFTLQRKTFEDRCKHLFDRVPGLIKEALEKAKL